MTITNQFVPCRQIISNITQANPGVITTTVPHGYDNTLTVRISYPMQNIFGMPQMNGQVGQVTVIDPSNFSIGINTTNFDAFNPSYGSTQYPQVIPIAETGYYFSQAVMNNYNIIPEL